MMWLPTYIAICVCVFGLSVTNVLSEPWVDRSLEASDEVNDVEMYKAVVASMNEWERRRKRSSRNARFKRQDTSVCYPELGCFESSGPFGYLDMLPNTPEEISTKFLLYPISSRRRRSGSEPLEIPFPNITNAMTWSRHNFNNSLPTKILIHGFGSDCTHIWVYEMRSALLTVEDCNVICVDWGNGATLPNYVKASANTRLVGKQLAIFLKGLVDNVGLPLEKMHLVGFSLGAHVAGFAGSELGNLSRITGLDPAGPLFESQDPRARLDQTDAAFVDVIHSNGENLILGGLGSWQPMGHVDFYPNGGRMQKGCTNLFVGALTDIIWSAAVEGRSLCNHRRAYKFFTDSIHPRCHFPAFPCDSYDDFIAGHCFPCNEERKCGNMGYYADRVKGRGQLYLVTRDEEPFCAHQYLIKIESSPAEVPIVSYGRIQVTLIGDTLLNETFTLTKKEDEEMRLGESISKIIVPHPILLPPSQVQVVYTSYTGWLTSGLLQWKIDKISLSDSYGKSVSICKKNLILDSGVPVVLPLFPGDCNLPTTDEEEDKFAEDRFDEKIRSKFVPNIEDKNNSLPATDPVNEIIKSSWSNDKDNAVDNEPESSRAFNTRRVKSAEYPDNKTDVREVVEPILKPQSTKNARSHNPNKERPEITEPILGPTTSKSVQTPSTTKRVVSTRNPTIVVDRLSGKEKEYPLYEDRGSDWVPAVNLNKKTSEKWKREDDSKSISINHNKPQRNENGFEAIVRTVQFLPQRIARMFEDAEKYARETILPFVSTYTPRFLSDIITPRETQRQKYVPLHFEEPTTVKIPRTKTKKATTTTTTQKAILQDEESNSVLPEVKPESTTKRKTEISTTTPPSKIAETTMSTTPHTHIQKIFKKNEKVAIVYPENSEQIWSAILSDDTKKKIEETENVDPQSQRSINSAKRSIPKEIYIDLPVFEDDYKKIKYIPITEKAR